MSNQDQQPPWGRNKKPLTPEEMVAQMIKKLQDFFSEEKKPRHDSSGSDGGPDFSNPFAVFGKIIPIIIIFLVIQAFYYSAYRINTNEVGVVLRFGQYHHTAQPGLNFIIPYIDKLYRVNVKIIRKEEFGFRSRYPGQKTTFDRSGYTKESLML